MNLVHPGEPGFVERRAMRRPPCPLEVTVRQRGRFAVAGESMDLTPYGARVEKAGPFNPAAEIWVRLPGLEGLPAKVAWSNGATTGVQFDQPLHPAVFARFLPADARLALVKEPTPEPSIPAEILNLPRREQIVRGYGVAEDGPMRRVKKPLGGGLAAMIHRNTTRRVEHRHEERFADALRTGPMRLTVAGRDAEVRNVSASGIKVRSALEADIGHHVDVRFEGFDAMAGQVVWRRAGETGIRLPDDSLELGEA